MNSHALQKFDAARTALAIASTVDEVKDIRDKAEALRCYLRQSGESLEMQNQAAAIKLRAERRAGELLAGMELAQGKRTDLVASCNQVDSPTLADIGIDKSQSHRWQRLAGLSEDAFEAAISEAVESHKELTTASMLRLAKNVLKATQPPPAQDAPADEPPPPAPPPTDVLGRNLEVNKLISALESTLQRYKREDDTQLARDHFSRCSTTLETLHTQIEQWLDGRELLPPSPAAPLPGQKTLPLDVPKKNPAKTPLMNEVQEVIDAFAAVGPEGVRVPRVVSGKLKAKIKTRLKDWDWKEGWREAIAKFPLKVSLGPDAWKPDLAWFVEPESVNKILEGRFDFIPGSNGKAVKDEPGRIRNEDISQDNYYRGTDAPNSDASGTDDTSQAGDWPDVD